MIYLVIEDNKYKIPQGYKEITLKRFKEIQNFLYSDHNKDIVEKIIEGDVSDEERALAFYIDFINYVTDIPKKILKKCHPYGDDSLQSSFEVLSFLLFMPNIENPKPIHKIGNLHFIDKITDGVMKDASFVEYMESSIVSKAFSNLKSGTARYEHLNSLLAVMYRPKVRSRWWRKAAIEDYDSDSVRDRIKFFDGVDMETVFNCLFFFMQLKTDLLKNTKQSLKEAVKGKQYQG